MSDVEQIKEMALYAWVGEDELGSGEVGIKQALTPAGRIPLVACKEGKMDQQYIENQLQDLGRQYGKKIRLVKFVYSEVVKEL
jgi:hypothetical protein